MLRALVGPTASGKTEAGIALAARHRCGDRVGGLDARVPGHGRRHGQAHRGAARGGCRTTCSTSRSRRSGSPSRGSSAAAHDVLETVDASAPGRGVRPVLPGDGRSTCGSRRRIRRSAPSLEARGRHRSAPRSCYPRLAAADPVAAARIDPANVRRTSERSRYRRSPGSRSATSPRHGRCTTQRACAWRACAPDARPSISGSGRGSRRCWTPAGSRRSAHLSTMGSARGSPPARRSATRSSRRISTVGWRSTRRWNAP